MVSFVCRAKGANLMTNKKFKKAAMALALTACVAATPLAANAETPENAASAQAPAAVDHAEADTAAADTQEAPEAELPVEEEPEAQPAAEAAAQPAAPEATPIAVELPTAEETPGEEEAPEEKEETPVEVTPTEDAVVEKETPAKVAPAPAKVAPAPAEADVDNLIEDPDADIATMDGVENAVSDEHEAKIGETSYGTLQGAIDSAKDGDTVVLNKNTSGSINIAKWIKLNLSGHTINGDVKVDLSKKQDGETTVDKKVEIVDGTITGATESGVTIKDAGDTNVLLKDLTIENNEGKQGGGVHIENSQNVTIDHCTIQNNKTTEVSKNGSDVSVGAGGGVFVSDNSHVTITDSQILDNTGTRGGGIYTEHSTVEVVEKSEIKNNIATDVPSGASNSNKGLGGGIYSFDSTLTVTDSTISDNEAKGSTSLIISNDGELSSSTLGNGGGGICAVGKKSDVTLDKVTVTGNKATSNVSTNLGAGGGIEAQGGSLTVKDSTISNNNARGNGGGIFSAEGNVLDVSGSTIQGNKGNNGGGIHTGEARDTSKTPSKATITDTKVLDNEITGGLGGGVYVGTRANATLKDCTVAGNKVNQANGMGGGICAYGLGFDVTLDNVQVENNTFKDQNGVGGGVSAYGFAVNPGKLTLKNGTTLKGNTAASGGGIYALGSMTILAENTNVLNNSATGWGGGVFAYNGVTLKANNTKFLGNTANTAGGILLWNNSSADLNNSEVSGNKATGNGGGVYVYDATCSLTTSNGTVFRENSGYRGGGIFSSGGTVTVEDSTFEKNTATDDGGAIAATQNSSLTVRNSKVLENKAADTAGGILAEKSTLEVTDSIIDGNRASVGGGLYIADIDAPGETKEDKPEHTITRTEITNNTADGQGIGGGIYLGAQKLTITDSKLTGNNTISKNGQTQGGAIVAYSPGDFTLDNTLIQGNTADVGGGIHVLSTKLRDSHIILCNNTRITGNVANLFGGGIFLDNMNNPAVLELVNASVDNNTANVAGGIGNYGSIVVLKDGAVLENNTAKQYGGGLYNRGKVTVESGATVMNNTASTYGGGLYNKGEAIVESGAKLYNNHAALAGDDIYLAGKNSTLTLTKVGDDWMLDDCGHKINGWFADLLDARWDADGKQEHVINLKDYAADGLTIVENKDGSYTITILDENATLALKAAHNVTPKPTPNPDPEPTPDPDSPDTPVSPEDPTTPPVQDATPDEAETPVNPENPANPPVQDATPDSTVAALPKTGVNWFTALAMALSGMALTVAGAFTSLFAKSKH